MCEWRGAAWASAGSEHGVLCAADNGIEAEGAVALAAVLKRNTTLQTLSLMGVWIARSVHSREWAAALGTREGARAEARAAGGCGRHGGRECRQ